MSEGTAKKRIKLKLGMPSSKNGTPQGSRAGSPDLGPPRNGTGVNVVKAGSRAGSPDAGGPAAVRKGRKSRLAFTLIAEVLTAYRHLRLLPYCRRTKGSYSSRRHLGRRSVEDLQEPSGGR